MYTSCIGIHSLMFRIYKILEIIALKYLKFKMWIYYFFFWGGGEGGGGCGLLSVLLLPFHSPGEECRRRQWILRDS